MGERDQIPRPFIKLSKVRPRTGLFNIVADRGKDLPQIRLAVDLAVDMGIICHRPPSLHKWPYPGRYKPPGVAGRRRPLYR